MKFWYYFLLLHLACEGKLFVEDLPHTHYKGTARFRKVGKLVSPVTYFDINVVFDIAATTTQNIASRSKDWKPRLKKKIDTEQGEIQLLDPDKQHADQQKRLHVLIEDLVAAPAARLTKARKDLKTVLELGGRQERSFLLGLLGGVVVGLSSALWPSSDVPELQEAVQQQNGMITSLAHGQQDILRMLDQIEQQHFSQSIALLRAHELAQSLSESAIHLEQLVAAVYDLRQGRLHPAFLPPATLAEVRSKIRDFIKQHDLKEVLDPVTEIFRAPFSYLITTQGWAITLHIPLVRDEEVMVRDLHKLVSSVFSEDRGGNVTRLRLSTDQTYLSLAKDGLLHDVHTHEELSLCFEIAKIHFCPEDAILYKQPQTCAGHLFFKDTRRALEECRREDLNPNSVLVEMDKRDFLLSSEDVSTVSCGKGDVVYVRPNGTQSLALKPDCRLSSTEVEIYSANATIGTETLIQHQHVNTTHSDSRAFGMVYEGFLDARSSLQALDVRDEDVLRRAKTLGDHLNDTLGAHAWTAPVALIVVTIIILVIIKKIYDRLRHHRTPVPTDEPDQRRSRRRSRSRSFGSTGSAARLARRLSLLLRPTCARKSGDEEETDPEVFTPIVKSTTAPAASRRAGGDCQGPPPKVVPRQAAVSDPDLNKAERSEPDAPATPSCREEEEGRKETRGAKPKRGQTSQTKQRVPPPPPAAPPEQTSPSPYSTASRRLLVEQFGIHSPSAAAAAANLPPSAPLEDSEEEEK